MRELFEKPELVKIMFKSSDVIATSIDPTNQIPDDDDISNDTEEFD